MNVFLTYIAVSLLAVLALGCSKKTEEPEHAEVKLTPEQIKELVDPAEDTPPMPTDHRLRLGIDGDGGCEQDELTGEELAKVRAAGAAVPQPSYDPQPSEPAHADQPSEAHGSCSSA